MQMLCKVSGAFSDVHCPVCGQGFMVYWTRTAARNREEQRENLLNGLRLQHGARGMADVHPSAFHLADRATSPVFGEAPALAVPAMLGVYS